MPRRLLRTALSAVVFASLIWAPSALADTFTPESGGSPNGDDIDTLYKLTLYIGIVIFLLVWGVLIWSLVKYRARREGVAQQIRGNTPLEKRIEYDLYYIENWSVRLDLKIMWLTIIKGFFHKHAY